MPPLPSIKDPGAPLGAGARVLLRLCMNVPMQGDKITDDLRLRRVIPTLQYLLDKGAKVTVISHLGSDGSHSLASVENYLRDKVKGGYIVRPNLRIDPREKGNDESFARELAQDQDMFVNEDFPASHREHASIVGVPKYLPSFVGLQFAQEVEHLSKFLNPPRPCVVILGGAKPETKLPMVQAFLPKADQIFLGSYFARSDVKIPKNEKIIIPKDEVKKNGEIVDVGQETLALMLESIGNAKSVIWNGPLGKFEEGFDRTTQELAKTIVISGAESVVGGGDSVYAIEKLNLLDRFTFVSTGGGAMLEFLSRGTLPGIEAILKGRVTSNA